MPHTTIGVLPTWCTAHLAVVLGHVLGAIGGVISLNSPTKLGPRSRVDCTTTLSIFIAIVSPTQQPHHVSITQRRPYVLSSPRSGLCCLVLITSGLTRRFLAAVVNSWGTDQVELWLLKLGFEQDVRECLRSRGVDGQYLLRLDDLTLRCLGVERLGDRKRLLRRLRGINNSCFFLDLGIYSPASFFVVLY